MASEIRPDRRRVYVVWTNKGGVGKTTLSFHISTTFAELTLDKGWKVLVCDLCPQANISMTLLTPQPETGNNPGNQSGAPREGADIVRDFCHERLASNFEIYRTVAGYVQSFVSRKAEAKIDPKKFVVRPCEHNSTISPNVYLLCGDPALDVSCERLEQYRRMDPGGDGEEPWKEGTVALRDFVDSACEGIDPDCKWLVIVDTNPALTTYTQMALVAADKIVMPVNADDFSNVAVRALFDLLYSSTDETGEQRFSSIRKLTFAHKAVEHNVPLPKIQLVVNNRQTMYRTRACDAFGQMGDMIGKTLFSLFQKYPERFVEGEAKLHAALPENELRTVFRRCYTTDLKDFHSVAVACTHMGVPLSAYVNGLVPKGLFKNITKKQASECYDGVISLLGQMLGEQELQLGEAQLTGKSIRRGGKRTAGGSAKLGATSQQAKTAAQTKTAVSPTGSEDLTTATSTTNQVPVSELASSASPPLVSTTLGGQATVLPAAEQAPSLVALQQKRTAARGRKTTSNSAKQTVSTATSSTSHVPVSSSSVGNSVALPSMSSLMSTKQSAAPPTGLAGFPVSNGISSVTLAPSQLSPLERQAKQLPGKSAIPNTATPQRPMSSNNTQPMPVRLTVTSRIQSIHDPSPLEARAKRAHVESSVPSTQAHQISSQLNNTSSLVSSQCAPAQAPMLHVVYGDIQQKHVEIGPEGGIISLNGFVLRVPTGALAVRQTLCMIVRISPSIQPQHPAVSSVNSNTIIPAPIVFGEMVSLGPSNICFSKHAHLSGPFQTLSLSSATRSFPVPSMQEYPVISTQYDFRQQETWQPAPSVHSTAGKRFNIPGSFSLARFACGDGLKERTLDMLQARPLRIFITASVGESTCDSQPVKGALEVTCSLAAGDSPVIGDCQSTVKWLMKAVPKIYVHSYNKLSVIVTSDVDSFKAEDGILHECGSKPLHSVNLLHCLNLSQPSSNGVSFRIPVVLGPQLRHKLAQLVLRDVDSRSDIAHLTFTVREN